MRFTRIPYGLHKEDEDTEPEATPLTPPHFKIGHTGSLVDFIQADCAAKTEFLAVQSAYQVKMKEPSKFNQWFSGSQDRKNAEVEEEIKAAARTAEKVRQPLRDGACQAFLDGQPEKIQHLISEPQKFMPIGFETHTISETRTPAEIENKFVTDILINLINDSTDPETVPARALKRVLEEKKTALLSSALHALITKHRDKDFEKVTVSLLQAGAEPSGTLLADALDRKLPHGVISLLLDKGANLDDARTILTDRKSESLRLIEYIQRDRTQQTLIEEMAVNMRAVTGAVEGRHRQTNPAPIVIATVSKSPTP